MFKTVPGLKKMYEKVSEAELLTGGLQNQNRVKHLVY